MELKAEETLGKIKLLAEEVSQRENCFLYDLEFSGIGRSRSLQVFIEDESGGVTVDQCANVSRGLGLLLDIDDLVDGEAYELEVSSPGLERRLTQAWHFEKILGEQVRIELKVPVAPTSETTMENDGISSVGSIEQGRKKLRGVVSKVESGEVTVLAEGRHWTFSPLQIKKANVCYNFEMKTKKK